MSDYKNLEEIVNHFNGKVNIWFTGESNAVVWGMLRDVAKEAHTLGLKEGEEKGRKNEREKALKALPEGLTFIGHPDSDTGIAKIAGYNACRQEFITRYGI